MGGWRGRREGGKEKRKEDDERWRSSERHKGRDEERMQNGLEGCRKARDIELYRGRKEAKEEESHLHYLVHCRLHNLYLPLSMTRPEHSG